MVCGSSMGAVIAAGCALGHQSKEICEIAFKFVKTFRHFDWSFPYVSLSNGKTIQIFIKPLLLHELVLKTCGSDTFAYLQISHLVNWLYTSEARFGWR